MKIIILDDHKLFTDGLCRMLKSSYNNIKIKKFNTIKSLEENIKSTNPKWLNLKNFFLDIKERHKKLIIWRFTIC